MTSRIFSGQTTPSVSKETFDNNYERIFGKWRKPMHKNEVVITEENMVDLALEAMELGPMHTEALNGQMIRQEEERQKSVEVHV